MAVRLWGNPCEPRPTTGRATSSEARLWPTKTPASTRVSVPSVVGKLLLSRSPEQSWLSFVTPTVAGLLGRCPSYASTGRVRFAVGLPGGMWGAPGEKSAMSADGKRDGCHLRRNREGEAVSNAVAHEGVAHFSLRHSRSRFVIGVRGSVEQCPFVPPGQSTSIGGRPFARIAVRDAVSPSDRRKTRCHTSGFVISGFLHTGREAKGLLRRNPATSRDI